VRRIHHHLVIGDDTAAVMEAERLFTIERPSPATYSLLIKSLTAAQEEARVLEVWTSFARDFPEDAYKREVLEDMCWGILMKGRRAGGLTTQLISLLGSALTQQTKAVSILKEAMQSSNAHLRSIAVALGAHYGDQSLKDEVTRLFYKETVWDVRKEVLNAISQLHLTTLVPVLQKKLSDPKLGGEEKAAIAQTLVDLRDRVERKELQILLSSRQSSLRQLGVEYIATFSMTDCADLLMPVLSDSQPDVKLAALRAVGLLRLPITPEIEKAASHRICEISVMAGWVLLLSGDEKGEKVLEKWLTAEEEKPRVLAAGAIASSGKYGVTLAQKMLNCSPDPFVRVNLAVALIRQRVDCERAAVEVAAFLQTVKEKCMWKEGAFLFLEKSTVCHNPMIPNCPEVMDQKARLDLVNLLSILEFPGAIESLKSFLKERRWKITGVAAEVLLEEGDESALDLVRTLLDDPDREVRRDAALVLASWGT